MNYAAQAGGEMKGVIDIDALWHDYHDRVYHWLYRMVGNAADAEDLTDCVFVRAWQRQGRYDPSRSSLCTWLYLTTRTVAIAFFRKRRLPMMSLEQLPESREPWCAGPEELYKAAEARARLWRAVDKLPEPERDIMSAHYHDELSWAEVAHKLGMCIRTVKFHAMRGLVLLRGILLDDGVR